MATIKDLRSITPRTNGTRALSAIKNIARHHSATTEGNWASFWKHWSGTKGWGTGGYHEIILRDGTVELCYDPTEITNGVGGQNSHIYNICLVGNGSFTSEQERAFDERARNWMDKLGLPTSAVKGHNEFPGQSTNCPGVNMNTVRARLSAAPPKMEEVEVANVEYEKDAKVGPALAPEFELAKKAGITDGTYPNKPATKAEVAVMVLRAYEKVRVE